MALVTHWPRPSHLIPPEQSPSAAQDSDHAWTGSKALFAVGNLFVLLFLAYKWWDHNFPSFAFVFWSALGLGLKITHGSGVCRTCLWEQCPRRVPGSRGGGQRAAMTCWAGESRERYTALPEDRVMGEIKCGPLLCILPAKKKITLTSTFRL